MHTTTVNPWTWQDAHGYSQGVLVSHAAETLYAAGQGPVDPDGNRDISPAFYEWMITGSEDTTAPDTFIVVHPDTANSGPDVTFSFASDEPVESFECSYGTGTPPAGPTTWPTETSRSARW